MPVTLALSQVNNSPDSLKWLIESEKIRKLVHEYVKKNIRIMNPSWQAQFIFIPWNSVQIKQWTELFLISLV